MGGGRREWFEGMREVLCVGVGIMWDPFRRCRLWLAERRWRAVERERLWRRVRELRDGLSNCLLREKVDFLLRDNLSEEELLDIVSILEDVQRSKWLMREGGGRAS